MIELKQVIHKSMRDDSDAVNGIRTLTGEVADPYGVYEGHFQGRPNFNGGKNRIVWQFLSMQSGDAAGNDARLRVITFSVAAYSGNADTVETIHKRVRWLFDNMHGCLQPTANGGVELHQIKLDNAGPDLFDDDFNVHYRAESYRAWYRENLTY